MAAKPRGSTASTKRAAPKQSDAVKVATNGDASRAPSTKSGGYVIPIVHVSVPAKLVDAGFWGGLTGAVALGVIDLPLGVLVGAGVVVARHQLKK